MLGADILAHPARSELAGLVIIEAMTAGLPVLVTDVCGYANHVQLANAGVVLPSPYNQVELNAALLNMLSDPQVHLQENGIKYTQAMSKQSSPQVEADLIVQFAHEKLKKT